MKRNKLQLALLALIIVNLIATVVLFYQIHIDTNGFANGTKSKYALYIGTNDKDTYQLEMPLEDCKVIVKEVCARYTSEFTIVEASGVWTDESWNISDEASFICYFNDVTEDNIVLIANDILNELNQSSILIERQKLDYYFYSKD